MKNIIVTGCSRGIGKAITVSLLESGEYYVIGTSTTGNTDLHHKNFICYPMSLENRESMLDFVTVLNQVNVSVNGLINNAAILLEDRVTVNIDFEQLHKTLEVNLFGTIFLTEQLLELMANDAHIINMSSGLGAFSNNTDATRPHYKISKAALNMYSKTLAARLRQQNITVSSYDPGWVRTDMGGDAAPKNPQAVGQEILDLLNRKISSGHFWHNSEIRDW